MSTTGTRIALLTYSTRPRGGVVHTLALAEALTRAGADVTVWSLARGGDATFFRPVDAAVRIRLVPFPTVDGESVGQRVLRSVALLGSAFAAESADYDVVHAEDCISANAVLPHRPDCLRTVHHLDRFTTPELVTCHERAIRDPAAHVCVSVAVARELAEGWRLSATVIPNGVDFARFAAAGADTREAARARTAWQERYGRYVLTVGGIEPRKGTLDLVEAMGLLARRRPDVPLLIAGGDTLFDYRSYRREVDDRASALGMHPVLLGSMPHDELPALVAGAAVFAFPSTQEGFGLAAMEALAAGVPLVTRDLPVLREVFGPAARFAAEPVALAAGLEDALESGRDHGRRRAGQQLAAAHSWDAAARAHLDLYARLGLLRAEQPTA